MKFKTLLLLSLLGLSQPALAVDTTSSMHTPPDNPAAIQATTLENQTDAVNQATETQQKMDLNHATTKELRTIPGITANKARAIVRYRKLHGEFKSVGDLKKVAGFKRLPADQFKAMQSKLTINNEEADEGEEE